MAHKSEVWLALKAGRLGAWHLLLFLTDGGVGGAKEWGWGQGECDRRRGVERCGALCSEGPEWAEAGGGSSLGQGSGSGKGSALPPSTSGRTVEA